MKLLMVALVALLLASNAFWLHREIDQRVIWAYQGQERYESANREIAAAVMASDSVRDKPKEEIEVQLKQLFPNDQVFEKDGALHTTWLTLPLTSQGRVSGVAADPLSVAQSQSNVRGNVGNEVFWPKK